MYVLVHHAIHDPRRFWSQAQEAIPNVPGHLTLHHTLAATDGTRATCLWEADSVESVREFLEPGLGAVSTNEYARAENREGIALASQPADTDAQGVVRALYDVFNTRDYGRLPEIVAPGAELTQVPTGTTRTGPEGMREYMLGWVKAFPDARVEVLSMMSRGPRVAVEVVGLGTHTGPLATPAGDLPPTGRSVRLPIGEFYLVRDGKIVRFREYFDVAGLLAQLGAGQLVIAEPMPPAR